MVQDKNISGVLISNPINIAYLTGFIGSETTIHEVYLLITQTDCFIFTNSLYLEQAESLHYRQEPSKKNATKKVTAVQISQSNPFASTLSLISKKYSIKNILFDPNGLTLAEFTQLKNRCKKIHFTPKTDPVYKIRQIKQEAEIRYIRKASEITDACYYTIHSKIQVGMTERELAHHIDMYIRKQGYEPSFLPIVAFGTNTSQPHYHPQDKQLTKNDFILFDFGAKVHGYCADMTRMIFLAHPGKEIEQAYTTTLNAQMNAIGLLTGSNPKCFNKNKLAYSGACLDRSAKNLIKKAGFSPYTHSLGHGVGLEIHEYPRLTIKNDADIMSGMTFTIEPAIYKKGVFGIRIEDTVYLSNSGLEILTKSPKEFEIYHII